MPIGDYTEVREIEITNEESAKKTMHTVAVANGKLIVPKYVPIVIIIILILTILGCAFAMGYFISYPRTSVKSLKLFNVSCTVLSNECDSSRGLYCPAGLCVCELTNSYYNGSTCTCPNLTLVAYQACSSYPSFGQNCSLPSTPCLPNFMCGSDDVCVCNSTAQYYNGSYCITQYSYNQPCTETLQCSNVSNLQCISNVCTCVSDQFWNGTFCVPKILGWQQCNNLTVGPTARPCDDTLSLFCYSNNTCQCPNTMFWEINDQSCETKRFYGDVCDGDFYCNETLNFICPTAPGTCNCPSWSNSYTCDCPPNYFFDGFQCNPRQSINGTCLGTYACDRTTLLVCYTGLCVCPTPTAWNGLNCVCSSGQTWTGSSCVVAG